MRQIRVGILSAAHVHAPAYASAIKFRKDADLIGIWDSELDRAKRFAEAFSIQSFDNFDDFLSSVDAVILTSENKFHEKYGVQAAEKGKHILCEKPLVTTELEGAQLMRVAEKSGVLLMTAFPCPYSPSFKRAKERVACGEIGKVLAICATNRGQCPWDWFVNPIVSGGGAMMDHVVHVVDLIRRLLGEDPLNVQAQIGNNLYQQEWEDTAMLTVEFPSGVFATIDSSWSRSPKYKTWGDVMLNIVGEKGLIELNIFNQHIELYENDENNVYKVSEFGTNLNQMLVDDFIESIQNKQTPTVTGYDGLMAARVGFAGYESIKLNSPVNI